MRCCSSFTATGSRTAILRGPWGSSLYSLMQRCQERVTCGSMPAGVRPLCTVWMMREAWLEASTDCDWVTRLPSSVVAGRREARTDGSPSEPPVAPHFVAVRVVARLHLSQRRSKLQRNNFAETVSETEQLLLFRRRAVLVLWVRVRRIFRTHEGDDFPQLVG